MEVCSDLEVDINGEETVFLDKVNSFSLSLSVFFLYITELYTAKLGLKNPNFNHFSMLISINSYMGLSSFLIVLIFLLR